MIKCRTNNGHGQLQHHTVGTANTRDRYNSGFILRRKNKIADKRNFIFGTPILQSGERDRIFILFSPPLIESVHHFPLIR